MAAHNNHGAHAPGLAEPERAEPAAAGLRTDHKDEARELGSGAGFKEQGTADEADSPGAAPVEQVEAKRFATLRARLALAGWALTRTSAPDGPVVFFATRWNMPRELASLDAVAAFADRVSAS